MSRRDKGFLVIRSKMLNGKYSLFGLLSTQNALSISKVGSIQSYEDIGHKKVKETLNHFKQNDNTDSCKV